MKFISLTQGELAVIDNNDFQQVLKINWWADRRDKKVYARGYMGGDLVYLHRFIMGAPAGVQVDHWDGNGLNCQRQNLRLCTNAQNSRAFQHKRGVTSQFRGVSWFKRDSCWRAHLNFNGKQKHLGYFDSEVKAAYAYDKAARQFFGIFSHPNFK